MGYMSFHVSEVYVPYPKTYTQYPPDEFYSWSQLAERRGPHMFARPDSGHSSASGLFEAKGHPRGVYRNIPRILFPLVDPDCGTLPCSDLQLCFWKVSARSSTTIRALRRQEANYLASTVQRCCFRAVARFIRVVYVDATSWLSRYTCFVLCCQ